MSDTRPSLAEIRHSVPWANVNGERHTGVLCDAIPTLLEIAEAAYMLEVERLHLNDRPCCDCGCFEAAREAGPKLRAALAKVRP